MNKRARRNRKNCSTRSECLSPRDAPTNAQAPSLGADSLSASQIRRHALVFLKERTTFDRSPLSSCKGGPIDVWHGAQSCRSLNARNGRKRTFSWAIFEPLIPFARPAKVRSNAPPASGPRRPHWSIKRGEWKPGSMFHRNRARLKAFYICYQSLSTVLGAKPHLPPIFDVS